MAEPQESKNVQSKAQRWLVAYDIRDPKRLARVLRLMNREGLRLQFSVYLASGARKNIEELVSKIAALIDDTEDDVRVYALTSLTKIWGLGQQFPNDGCILVDGLLDSMKETVVDVNRTSEQSGVNFAMAEKIGNPVRNNLFYNENSDEAV